MSMFETRNRKRQAVDVSRIESEIDAAIRQTAPGYNPSQLNDPPSDLSPPAAREATTPLPAYVDHHAEVGKVGRLSASNIVMQYENAAKSIEAMGEDLKKQATSLEESLQYLDAALLHVQETAQYFRDEGKKIFERVEQASLRASRVKEACDDMRKTIVE